MQQKKIIIIGSGFAALSAAGILAKEGHKVTILEKNGQPGGRASIWQSEGFTFDMGPSWYWMPDVFENYFNLFGKTTTDFYDLKRLDPSYRIFYPEQRVLDVPASMSELMKMFEQREKGSGQRLSVFLKDAEYKYKVAMSDYVYRISDSALEYLDIKLLAKSIQLKMLQSLRSEVRASFKHPELVSLLEFPVLFLGAMPDKIPAMYSMMNYADLQLGTWYPIGGMHQIIKAMVSISTQHGAIIKLNQEVTKIETVAGRAKTVHTTNGIFHADIVISGADYHHTEQQLLGKKDRRYSAEYWNQRTMSPSSLLFYLGIDKQVPNLQHHNLFFEEDFELHANEIYTNPKWPTAPLFYACVPSKNDSTLAPAGMENVFLLMPLAPGIEDLDYQRERCFNIMLSRLEKRCGTDIRNHIVVKRSFCLRDFKNDYNSFKGNAYGLANTLSQTAILKPKMKSDKVKNLFYTGQLTVPGPGVPPAIISGQIVAKEIIGQIAKQKL